MYPAWYATTLKQPEEGSWDMGATSKQGKKTAENFWEKCYIPYWHEAHHVVPNSTLANAIADVDGGTYAYPIRRGLAKEGYNLNHKDNMIMLPMDIPVSKGMGLPRHRKTATHRSHRAYSKNIKNQLDPIFGSIAKKLKNHEKRSYKNVMNQIVTISKTMYTQISKSESPSLDDMPKSEF